jgi:hypothetical protein
VPALSHLTSCTLTKSSLYLANSLTTVTTDPDLYRLLTFHVPNLISLFHCLGRTEESVWFRGFLWYFVTWLILYGEELLAPHQTPTPFRLSATAYSIYSQLPSIYEGRSSIRNLRTRHAVVTALDPFTTVKGTHLSRSTSFTFPVQLLLVEL